MKEAVLITRENIVCSELTKEQFVSMMMEDIKKSAIESERIFKPIEEDYHKQCIEKNKESVIKRATEFAERKWKTEKKRKAYIESEIEKLNNKPFYFNPVSFFDFDIEPSKLGINGWCIFSVNSISEYQLEKVFDLIVNNKYFKSATGWRFTEKRNSRSEIELIMPDEMVKLFKNEEQKLTEAISNFYSGSNYWGD